MVERAFLHDHKRLILSLVKDLAGIEVFAKMDEKQLEETVRRAATNLFEHQPNMFDFTSETNQTEWNLAHHLAVEIHQFFPDLDCDVDVIKVNLERKRPDIILHRRGGEDNFVVIEG